MQGDRVHIVGLVRCAELNGLGGVCKTSATSATAKVNVLLDNGKELNVPAANLLCAKSVSSLNS